MGRLNRERQRPAQIRLSLAHARGSETPAPLWERDGVRGRGSVAGEAGYLRVPGAWGRVCEPPGCSSYLAARGSQTRPQEPGDAMDFMHTHSMTVCQMRPSFTDRNRRVHGREFGAHGRDCFRTGLSERFMTGGRCPPAVSEEFPAVRDWLTRENSEFSRVNSRPTFELRQFHP